MVLVLTIYTGKETKNAYISSLYMPCLVFQVNYEVLPGWQSDISSVRRYDELPQAARLYVERIEELVGVPVHYIGVGPGRDALIYK